MQSISIKALLISNLVQLVMAVVICWFSLGVAWDMDVRLLPLIFAVTIIPPSVIAGYVAGRVAARSHVLNGILSSSAWTLFWIYLESGGTVLRVSFVASLPYMTASFGAPLLGAVGGLVARHIERRRRETESRQQRPS
jgi:hypothetical protein